jgi:hypothetical protein
MAALKASLGQCPFTSLCSSVRIDIFSSSHIISPHVAPKAEDDHSWLQYAAELNTAHSIFFISRLLKSAYSKGVTSYVQKPTLCTGFRQYMFIAMRLLHVSAPTFHPQGASLSL